MRGFGLPGDIRSIGRITPRLRASDSALVSRFSERGGRVEVLGIQWRRLDATGARNRSVGEEIALSKSRPDQFAHQGNVMRGGDGNVAMAVCELGLAVRSAGRIPATCRVNSPLGFAATVACGPRSKSGSPKGIALARRPWRPKISLHRCKVGLPDHFRSAPVSESRRGEATGCRRSKVSDRDGRYIVNDLCFCEGPGSGGTAPGSHYCSMPVSLIPSAIRLGDSNEPAEQLRFPAHKCRSERLSQNGIVSVAGCAI